MSEIHQASMARVTVVLLASLLSVAAWGQGVGLFSAVEPVTARTRGQAGDLFGAVEPASAAAARTETSPRIPDPPAVGATPSDSQLAWHELEYYGFLHYGLNTYTGKEWGLGSEKPSLFNPDSLEAADWAEVAKNAGMKALILVVKHHSGFTLWPSEHTEYSVENSPWKSGAGDVLEDLAAACRERGLKLGIYYSPWDRNSPDYGTNDADSECDSPGDGCPDDYVVYLRNQLREVLDQDKYGEIFEVWFDGANGGSGYYKGYDPTRTDYNPASSPYLQGNGSESNNFIENRPIDRKTYYEWSGTYELVSELQPDALIRAGGAHLRWVGNDWGESRLMNWSTLSRIVAVTDASGNPLDEDGVRTSISGKPPAMSELYPGFPGYRYAYAGGQENGTHWMPGEADVPIRPGWFHHADASPKSLELLHQIYYATVGRNSALLLNFAIDRSGNIPKEDIARVNELKAWIDQDFETNLALNGTASATDVREPGSASKFKAGNVNDGDNSTYWATNDGVRAASVTIEFGEPTEFNRLLVQEYIRLGQRVKKFSIEYETEAGEWERVPVYYYDIRDNRTVTESAGTRKVYATAEGGGEQTTIGYKRIVQFDTVRSSKVRLNILDSRASPLLSNVEVFRAPGAPNTAPEITSPGLFDVRENQARVTRLTATDANAGDEVTGWAIVGGADRDRFRIVADTGELSFRAAPNFEAPSDVLSSSPPSGAGDNEYIVVVRASSGAGERERTAEQPIRVRVTDVDEPPSAPPAPTITGETSNSPTVFWTEPDNTGPPITGYDVQYQGGGSSGFTDAPHAGTDRALTLTELKAGTTYQMQVRARNEEGMGDWSEPGEGRTIALLTVQMTTDLAPPVEGPFTLRFRFSETVTGFTQTAVATEQEPPCTDTGNNPLHCDPVFTALQTTDNRVFSTIVTPQTDRVADNYTITITVPAEVVRSSVGNKPNEAATREVRIAPPGVTVPISSLGLTASPSNGQMALGWNAPENSGGSAIIRYEYRVTGRAVSGWRRLGPAERAATLTDLTNGTEYTFQVRAVNALGYGGVETVRATPATGGGGGGGSTTSAPGAPRNLTAVGEDGEVVLSWDAPASDGGAEITDYEYRIDGRNPWISIGSTLTTHTVTGLVNGTAYVFEVRAVNRIGTGRVPNQTEATPEAPEVFTLDFAHFANGDGTTSALVFVNVAPQPVRAAIYFYDTEGALVSAESVVEITGDLVIQEDGGLTVLTAMEPLGELTISTHGRGDVVSGSVTVVSDAPVGAMLRFALPGIGETVVGASPPISDTLFPVRRQEGGITTGVAVHNRGAEAMGVMCELMQEGVLRDAVSLPLEANGQTSWLIDQAFPAADTSDFVGSVRCDADGEGLFSALALEMDPGTRTFITLPLFPVNRLAGGRAAVLDFAHFANGDGTTSDLVFLNLSTERSRPAPTPFHVAIPPIRPAIYFYDTEGNPIAAESVVDVTGDLAIQEDGGLTVLTEMEPLGVLTVSTHGQGPLVSGSVRVLSNGPIGGMLRYNLPHIGEAVVGASQPVSDAIFTVRRREGGITTGVAIHNLESSPGLVHCDLMREGVLRDAASFPLEANGQTSWLIGQAFPGTDTSDFTGSVRCDAVGEGLFSAVALEMDPATRTFITLPVFPVPEMPDRE